MDCPKELPQALLPWYVQNCRELPWRRDREPYHVWLSEIMLQQTRVEAVKGYYTRFLEALPTIEALAACDDELLYKLWEGLGYYSRVRNLKKAAGIVITKHRGQFPRDYKEVLALPGIGEYTAGAICSICFDLSTPAVDGNVLRVMSRLLDDDTPIDMPQYKKKVFATLAQVYPREAGDFTQALMELGATICGPNRMPDCEVCPCKAFCLGYARGTAAALPVKTPKKGRRLEEKTVFLLCCDGMYALQKRPSKGLLAGLWQFPDVEGKLDIQKAIQMVELWGLQPKQVHRVLELKHIFTHVEWDMRCCYLEVESVHPSFIWLTEQQIQESAALPTAYRQFWDAR